MPKESFANILVRQRSGKISYHQIRNAVQSWTSGERLASCLLICDAQARRPRLPGPSFGRRHGTAPTSCKPDSPGRQASDVRRSGLVWESINEREWMQSVLNILQLYILRSFLFVSSSRCSFPDAKYIRSLKNVPTQSRSLFFWMREVACAVRFP